MTHHSVMTSSLLINNLKIDKFDDFSSDIDFKGKTDIFRDVISLIINQYKRASLLALRLADTLCPPEAPCGRLGSPLFSYIGDNMSKYVCLTVIIEIARKITKFVSF